MLKIGEVIARSESSHVLTKKEGSRPYSKIRSEAPFLKRRHLMVDLTVPGVTKLFACER